MWRWAFKCKGNYLLKQKVQTDLLNFLFRCHFLLNSVNVALTEGFIPDAYRQKVLYGPLRDLGLEHFNILCGK